jgi:hypothetical protein
MLRFTEMLKGKQHKIDKNKNGKVDAHDFKLLRKEEQEIAEATVDTKKYSWGTMKTVHHGSSFSIPLHPEHHQAIAKLKDQQEHKFKTEDGKHWTAKRDGEKVHFQGANNGGKTSVSHSTMKEEVEIDEAAWGQDKMANLRAAHDRHMEKALAANKAGNDEATKVHQSKMQMIKNKMNKLKQNEEVELEMSDLDGLDLTEEGLKDACWKGYQAIGMKMKNGKKVPNCVPVKEEKDEEEMCDECDMPESECECDHEDDKEEMKEGKHVVGVTISDPNHSMVSQRNEKKFRKAKVSAPDKDTAINNALAYYKKRGYKVHDHNYVGLHTEGMTQQARERSAEEQARREKALKDNPKIAAEVARRAALAAAKKSGVKEEIEISELSKDTLDRYREKAFADQPSTRSDNPAKYDKRKAGRDKAFDKVLGRKPVKEDLEEKLNVGGGTPVKGPNGVVSNTPAKTPAKKPASSSSPLKPASSVLDRVRSSMRKEAADVPFDGPYTTSKPAKKNSDGTTQSPMSRARELAKQSIPKKMKEDLDEERINGREYASQGVMHPDHAKMDIHKVSGQHVDFYASKTGDKMQGKVTKNDGKSVHIQAHKELGDGKLHKFKVQRGLPKPQNESAPVAPTLDKKYIKGTPENKAYKATKKPINGMPTNVKEGRIVVKTNAANMDDNAKHIEKLKAAGIDANQGAGSNGHIIIQDRDHDKAKKILAAHLKEDLDEKMDMAKSDMGDVITDFKKSDAPQFAGKSEEKRRQMAIAAKLQADKAQKEERELKNYKQFVEDIYQNLPEIEEEFDNIDEDVEQLDEYESGKDGVYRHTKKATYGTSYQGDDDEDEKPKKPATGEKRGRGRPAGSSSGARQKGTTAKKRSGVEYTGFKLHLPNNNR